MNKRRKTPGPDCVTSLSENLRWLAGPHLHTDLQQITGAVRSPVMLQTPHHHPRSKETQNYWTEWLQTCGSNVCGHEIIWKTGFGLFEENNWTLTRPGPTEQTGLLSESLVQPSPVSKNCTHPEWVKGLAKPLWTPHIQHNPSLNCYLPVDTTELWTPERPDTGTVSFLKQSISWTLYIKRGTHNTIIHYLFTTHAYFLI